MQPRFVFWLGLLMAGWLAVPAPVQADDFLDNPKSDSSIKPFTFPKSMKVIQSCTATEFCVHHEPGVVRGATAYEEDLGLTPNQVNRILTDKQQVRKTLMKIDPARLAPLTLGDDLHQPVNRGTLFRLGDRYDEDILLLYRVTFHWERDAPFLRLQSLMYLAKQDKVLALPDFEHGVEYGLPHMEETIDGLYFSLLEQLENEARRVLHAHKHEQRRSGY